jgi:hypothetical protein
LDETFWGDQVSAVLRCADSDGDGQVFEEEINEMIALADTYGDGLIVRSSAMANSASRRASKPNAG